MISTHEMYPNLAGQKKLYLMQAMKAYRVGVRKNELMNAWLNRCPIVILKT